MPRILGRTDPVSRHDSSWKLGNRPNGCFPIQRRRSFCASRLTLSYHSAIMSRTEAACFGIFLLVWRGVRRRLFPYHGREGHNEEF